VYIGELYPYQSPVIQHFADRGSLLLAFAPGTGKTNTSLACAEHLMDEGYVSLCLVICPAALKFQWKEKIEQFTDSPVDVVDGTKEERSATYARIMVTQPRYVIISYDYVLLDNAFLSQLPPEMVILDEASAIKSFRTQRSKKIKKLFKDVPYRLALTATPIENKPEEVFSIMQFVDSSVLGRYDLFEKAYITRSPRGWVTAYKNLDVLKERLGDAMVRKARADVDVSPYLPAVDASSWLVPLDKKLARVYCEIAKGMLTELDKVPFFSLDSKGTDAEDTPPGRLMAMHMVLEMLLCHPGLIQWSADNYLSDKPKGSEYAYLTARSENLAALPVPKLEVLKAELEPILADPDSKVLIYSKYKYMLEILQKELPYLSVIFTGDMSAKLQDNAKKQFATSPNIRLFLSSYAGGYGLDMNMASHLINYDLPWAFGQQDQINSRHIRASSEFDVVFIRNLVVSNTIEERKMRVLERKRRISELAIDGATPDSAGGDAFDYTVALDQDFLRNHLTWFIKEHL
jgi:SNF2 family DNA or RNA helicase